MLAATPFDLGPHPRPSYFRAACPPLAHLTSACLLLCAPLEPPCCLCPFCCLQCNTFLGTVTYMSPERINGQPYSFPADIWALGLTLLECATGKYPYDASGGTIELMIQARRWDAGGLGQAGAGKLQMKESISCHMYGLHHPIEGVVGSRVGTDLRTAGPPAHAGCFPSRAAALGTFELCSQSGR